MVVASLVTPLLIGIGGVLVTDPAERPGGFVGLVAAMEHSSARGAEVSIVGHADGPPDRGMQLLEYAVAALSFLAAALLALAR